MNKQIKLMLGDNIMSLKKLPENSIDSIVTDPPYGLSFMGKKWDYDVPSTEFWQEVYRVLKPGGHVLSFGGTRTYHRMVVNMEDAGFEIRDQIQWLYGVGFPKSHNIGKAFDKKQGNEREVVGDNPNHRTTSGLLELGFQDGKENSPITKGSSQYEGWGTALKPANEPICLARKPLSEKTIIDNVVKWGTGGINVDGCRIDSLNNEHHRTTVNKAGIFNNGVDKTWEPTNADGRFPANIIFDETAAKLLDEQANASRFFYVAKVSKKERNLGLDGFEEKENKITNYHDLTRLDGTYKKIPIMKNTHPTLKPVNLMTYLCRLITPPGGIVLDPFMGSGSTGISACLEGFRFVGMELDEDYFKIAEARINSYEQYRELLKK